MKQWFIKTFQKRKAVRIFIALESNRLIEYWCIPNGDTVNIKGVGAFKLDVDKLSLTSKNVPTYIFNINNAEPINLQNKKTETYMSPQKYQTGLNERALAKLVEASQPPSMDAKTMIILVAIVGVNLFVWYTLNEQLTALVEKFAQIGL